MPRTALALGCFALLVSCATAAPRPAPDVASLPDALHVWRGSATPDGLERWIDAHLAAAEQAAARARADGPRTVEATLRAYDDAQNELAIAGNGASLLNSLSTSAEVRDKAQALSRKASAAATALGLDRGVYDALAQIPTPADPAVRHYLERTLLQYRLQGVDKDAATRARVAKLQDRITELSLVFGRNVQESVLKVSATRDELEGVPADWLASHKPSADGKYTVTTDEPDVWPVLTFARSAELRRKAWIAYTTRAYPANKQVLLDLLGARQELATLLGFPHFVDLATADQMTGSAAAVEKLLADLDAATRPQAAREADAIAAFAHEKDPQAKLTQADRVYWREQLVRARYQFDEQSVRPYFPYEQVEKGILETAARFFGVELRRVDEPAWHPSVSTFDVYDGGRRAGRIYLDMHPREGKDKWFSAAPVVPGIGDRQLPEGMLVCNFTGGVAGDPGLMLHHEVSTFFHELGHLMHFVLGSRGQLMGLGAFAVENDFTEAPSQMLEELMRDRNALAPFARHYQTGEVIPAELVDRMKAANFGRASWVQWQLFYTALSLHTHDRAPAELDLDKLLADSYAKYSIWEPVEGDRLYAVFTHLTGYSSNYYTYLLDKVIALDFFAQFDAAAPLDGPVPKRYRKAVLEPGGGKPAADLVRDFLGRPHGMGAIEAWIKEADPDARKPAASSK